MTTDAPATTTDATATQAAPEGEPGAFTQEDVDRIVKERVARERAKYADHEALRAEAAKAKTLEQRLADVEKETTAAAARALRAEIAAEYGISTKKGAKGEASDAELFLTGADEDTLRAQAERLGSRKAEAQPTRQRNVVAREGTNPKAPESEERAAVRQLFNG